MEAKKGARICFITYHFSFPFSICVVHRAERSLHQQVTLEYPWNDDKRWFEVNT